MKCVLPYLITIIISLLMTHVSGVPSRIAGGRPIKKGEFEYFVQLRIAILILPNSTVISSQCGASLIHPIWILTAAHCFKTKRMIPQYIFALGLVRAFMGTEKVVKDILDPRFTFRRVDEARIHPEYFYKKIDKHDYVVNDVAIAKLNSPFDKNARIIDLPVYGYAQLCRVGTIIGGGNIELKKFSRLVKYHPIEVKTKDQLSIRPPDESSTLFYSEVRWYRGHPLQGDSGGPFVCDDKRHPIQYGIISRVLIISRIKIVISIYEAVDKYQSFIKQYVPLNPTRNKAWHLKNKHRNDGRKEVKANSQPVEEHISFTFLCIVVALYVIHDF